MRVQLVGLGHVGNSLVQLIDEKEEFLKSIGLDLQVVSISDSKGTVSDENGFNLKEILRCKSIQWKDCAKYEKGVSALDAIGRVKCDVLVELTPSTLSGEPGLANINAALRMKENVVTANKGPLVVDFEGLVRRAKKNGVKLLYEATVAAHLPVFCLTESCFKADRLDGIMGILNATTNYVLGEMEIGRSFEQAVDDAVRAGWAESNYSDDVDGVDSARKLVIIANALFGEAVKLKDVKVEGIRHVEPLLRAAREENARVKLLCKIIRNETKLEMTVSPKVIAASDPFATVNQGNMALQYTFRTSHEIFVSANFIGPRQTAYAVLNDIVKIGCKTVC